MPHNLSLDWRIELRDIENRHRGSPDLVGLGLDGLAKAWLDDCVENHALCPKPHHAVLPTRLIDVGQRQDDPDLDQVRLIAPKKGSRGTWTALSYCWGKIKATHHTTKANLEDRLTGSIPLSLLPRTIRDAIQVTRDLGVQYIWIDALCIVQDSQQDWEVEASTMMNVYRNAYLTIAANEGDTADGGLCLDRNILESRPYEFKFKRTGSSEATSDGSIFPSKFRWMHPPRQPWERTVSLSSLQTRGWTLQETTLAARIIYYDAMGLYWQCREGIRQERVPAYLIRANDYAVAQRRIFDWYSGDPQNIFGMWESLVQEFTARKLSHESDRLYAIAGIASAISAHIRARRDGGRRLATPEETELYANPKLKKHWAVPDNPDAVDETQRYDGGNSSLRWILSEPGRPAPMYNGGPLSMDPWLALRFTGNLDREAEKEFASLSPRAREIMASVGMEALLKFVDDVENPDYDDEYIHLMSHIDTHAAYHRAYQIWMEERGRSVLPDEDDTAAGDGSEWETEEEEVEEEEEERSRQLDVMRNDTRGKMITHAHREPNGDIAIYHGKKLNAAERENEIKWKEDFDAQISSVQDGILMDSGMETSNPSLAKAALYVYDAEEAPIKARKEWPSYVVDDEYLAGLWRADLFRQLQWFCIDSMGRKRASTYRAPSWSWASMAGTAVSYDNNDKEGRSTRQEGSDYSRPVPRLLQSRVRLRGNERDQNDNQNRFGDVGAARLTLLVEVRDLPFYPDQDVNKHWSLRSRDHGGKYEIGELAVFRLDEPAAGLDPWAKLLRLGDCFCLIVEYVGSMTWDPPVFRRIGCLISQDTEWGGVPEVKEGAAGWEEKVVKLI